MAGCSSSTSSDEAPETPSEDTGTPASPIRDDTIPLGESITYQGQVQVTVDETRLANTISTNESGEIEPESGRRFLLARVSSTNVGDEQVDLATDQDFALLLGSEQRDLYQFDSFTQPTQLTNPVSGPIYEGQSDAFADVSTAGWLVFQVPLDTEHAVIAWGRANFDESEQAYWRTTLAPDQLSGVQLVSVDVPESATRYQSTEITLTIENGGGAAGTYEATIGEDLNISPLEVSVAVPAGKTVEETVSLPYSDPAIGGAREEATLTIGGEEYTISYSQPRLQLGESFTTQSGLEVTVHGMETGTELRTYNSISGSYETAEVPAGYQLVYVDMEVANTTGQSLATPQPRNISLLNEGSVVGDMTYPPQYRQARDFGGTISSTPYTGPQLRPNAVASGYVIFLVASEDDPSQLDVQWSAGYNYGGETDPTVVWEQ